MSDSSRANIEALHEQRDWRLVTLSCIGDAVIHHRHQQRRNHCATSTKTIDHSPMAPHDRSHLADAT